MQLILCQILAHSYGCIFRIILGGCWSLVCLLQPAVGFLEIRGWKGPEALREIGMALLASSAWLCSQPHTPDFSSEGLLPWSYLKHRPEAEEMCPATSPPPRCRTTPAIFITFLLLDPSHGCCSLSAFSFVSQSHLLREGLGWDTGGADHHLAYPACRTHRAPRCFP